MGPVEIFGAPGFSPSDASIALNGGRQAAGSVGGVTFDGLTSGTRGTVPLTWTIGTGDFSAWVRFRCPSTVTVERGVIGLGPNATDAGGAGSFRVILQTTGTMSVRLGTVPETLDFAGFVAAFGGQWVDVVVTRGSAGWTVYVNGLAAAPTSGSLTAASSINSSYLVLGVGLASTNIFNSIFHRAAVFNRTLSAADVASLVVAGVSQADQWGAPATLGFANGGFESNAAGTSPPSFWTASGNHVATVVDDATVEGARACEVVASAAGGSGAGNDNLQHDSVVRIVGRRYRMRFSARTVSGNASLRVGIGSGDPQPQSFFSYALSGTYTEYAEEFVATAVSGTTRLALQGAGTFRVDNFRFERIGAIVDLDFTMGCGNQLQDMSSNGFHVNLFGGFSWLNPRDFGQLRVTISQLGNTVFPVGLPAEAMITGIAANSAGAVTLSIGTAMGGTQVVNAAALSTGRNGPLTVASAFPGGTLWGNLSAAVATNITINFSLTT